MSKRKTSLWLVAVTSMVAALAVLPATPVQAAAATHLSVLTQPSGAVNGVAFTQQPVIQLLDGTEAVDTSDNATVVTAAILSGTGSFIVVATATASSGVATFVGLGITGTAGNFTLRFTSSPVLTPVDSSSFALTFGAATASAITTQPSGAVNGVAFTQQPVVRIIDSGGNTVTDSSVNVVATISSGSGGVLSGTTTVAASSGVATFTNLVITGTGGPFKLTFTPTSLTAIESSSFTLTFGTATASAITTQPSGAVNGAAFTQQPVVRIVDASGNTVTNSSVNVVATIASGTGTLSGTTTVAASSGVATFTNLVITGTVGNFTLTFTPTSLTAITSGSFALTFGAATASAITTQPSGAVNGVAFTQQPVVRIIDSGGNTVTNSSVNVVATIASGTGTLSGTTTVAASSGVATFTNLVITGTAGNFTLTFTPTSLTAITSGSFALTFGAATASAITTQPSGAVNGVAFTQQPVVRIVDSGGNTVTDSSVNVVATISSGSGGVLSGTTTVAASSGVATFTNLVITGTGGPFKLTFTPTSLTAIESSSFTLTFGTATASAITTQPAGAVNGVAFTQQPVVRIVDASGNTVTNSSVDVVATISSGSGGVLSGTTTVAASSGVATFTNLVITGTAGPFKLTFTPTSLTAIESSSFTLTFGTATASAITTQPSGAVNGVAFTQQPVVRIVDASGNTVTNSSVNVVATIASGTGTLSGTTTVAASSGVATFTNLVITGTVGNFTLTFTPTSLTAITSGSFALTFGAATASAITTQPSGAVNGVAFTQQPVVRIIDSGGNTVTNSSVNVVATIASGTGTLSGTTTVAASSGVATFTNLVITGTAGNFTLTFTPTSLTAITSGSFALTFGAATASAITTQPSGAVNGVALTQQPVVRIIDSGGNTVTNSSVNVVATIASGTGTLSGTTTVAASSGVATFTDLVITGTVGNFTLTFTPTSLTAITSGSFALTFGTATASAITTQPSGAVNGVAFTQQPVVRIVDASGNTVTNSSVNVVATISSGSGGVLSGTTTVAASSGVATFTNLVITGTTGPFKLTFTPTSLTAIESSSFTLTFGTATASAMTTQPSGAVNGVAFTQQPVVRIVDASGNTVTNSSVNVVATIASGTGTLSGTTTVAASSGVATFTNLVITGTVGNFTLTFTPTSLTAITSGSFALTFGAATASAMTTQPSGAVNGVAFTQQPVVRIVDSGGNTVTNSSVNVVATIASGTGTLSGTTTVAASSGVATFTNLVITGTAGNFTLTFTPTSLTAITSGSFALTFGAATASAITTQPSGAVNGVAFTQQPVVRIVDSGGNTVTNSSVNVVATIASGTGTLSGTTTVAASSGVATFTDLVITGTAGNFTLTFTPTSLTAITSGSFALTFGTATASAITTQPSGAVNGVAFTQQPVVRIVDASGNTVTNSSVNVVATISSGSGGVLSGTTTVAASSGVATFTNLVITGTAGPFKLTFTPTSLTAIESSSFTLTFGTATASAMTTQPTGAVNGVAFTQQPVVRIVDASGNTVTNSSVNVVATIASGTGTLSGTTTVAASSGVATFTNLVITGTAGNFTLTFTPTSLTAITSGSFALTFGTATASAMTTQPSGAVNGVAFTQQPVVRIVDASGNTVTNSSVNVVATIASGTGTLSGTTTVAASSGVATFTNLVITGTAGNFTLTFTPTSLTAITSGSFALTFGSAAALAVTTQPSGAVNNVAFTSQPVVRVVDSGGNTVTSDSSTVTVAIQSGTGTLTTTLTASAASGVATFSGLKLVGTAGNFTLRFTDGALTLVDSASFALTFGTATASAITTQPSGAAPGVVFTTQPVVRIIDASSNTVTNSTVNVVATIASGTGTLSGTTTVAAIAGIATFTDLVLSGTAGNFTLTFTPTSLTAITSASFALAAVIVISTASALAITTQPGGTVIGAAFTTQPVVRVVDSSGNTFTSSATVTVAASGGTLSGTTSVSAVAGVATFTNLMISGTAGNFTLTFASSGLTSVTSASLALADAPVGTKTDPVSFDLSPTVDNSINVQIQGTASTHSSNITINIPKNSTAEATTVKVFSNSENADVDAGFISVRIESVRTADNSAVTTFTNAIEIRIPTTTTSASPAWSRDGLTWTLLPRLSEPVLPEGQADGYYVNVDGSYSFFTRHLTIFGLLRTQAPMTLAVSQSELKVGETASLTYTGGSGTGAMTFRSIDPAVCTVTSTGVVSGISAGQCSVTATRLGSGSYLDLTSVPVVILISNSKSPNIVLGSSITVRRRAGTTTIKVSLPLKYANKLIRLEWGVKKGGAIFYCCWGNTRANSKGVASLPTTKIITPNTTVRAMLGLKLVAKRNATVSP